MASFTLDLVPIWTAILGIGVFLYVLLDGFDLGVGILFGFAPDTASRNLLMASIAPVWDGNETWLILGGVGLLAVFPLAFAIIMPAVYFPLAIMLLALVFRGVAFEFRYRDAEHKTFWDHAFVYGSGIAAFAQGIVLGLHSGLQGRRAALRRVQFRLFHALLDPDRRSSNVRLRPTRRGLAHHQNRGRSPGESASAWPLGSGRRRNRHRHRESMDASI
jgi:cytochrome d oxidase subunit CydB